jgi:hypothetical protein
MLLHIPMVFHLKNIMEKGRVRLSIRSGAAFPRPDVVTVKAVVSFGPEADIRALSDLHL